MNLTKNKLKKKTIKQWRKRKETKKMKEKNKIETRIIYGDWVKNEIPEQGNSRVVDVN